MKKIIVFLIISFVSFSRGDHSYKYRGDTLLTIEIDNGNAEKVKSLIDSGVDLNEKTKDDFTPLEFALSLGEYKIAEILIDAGTNKEIKRVDLEENYLFKVIDEKAFKTFELLLNVKKSNIKSKYKVKWSDYSAYQGNTLLEYSSRSDDYFEATKCLIDKGANTNEGAPLRVALGDYLNGVLSAPRTFLYLIEHGAKLHYVFYGDTILNKLLYKKQNELVLKGINKETNLNIPNFQGFTPLMIAASNKMYDVFELLLNYGADYNLCTPEGIDVFELAQKDEEIKKILEKRNIVKTKKKYYPTEDDLAEISKLKGDTSYSKGYFPTLVVSTGDVGGKKTMKLDYRAILYHNMSENGMGLEGDGMGLGATVISTGDSILYLDFVSGKVGAMSSSIRGSIGINLSGELYTGVKFSCGLFMLQLEIGVDKIYKKTGDREFYYTGIGIGF